MTADATLAARRASARSWWADGLAATPWILASVALSLFIADGGLLTVTAVDWVYIVGRALGLIAAVLMLTQVTLVARVPFVEKVLGHDRAVAAHTSLGKFAVIAMLAHAGIIVAMTAYHAGMPVWQASIELGTSAWYLAAAQIALGAFLVVLATSIAIVRRRWRYETWHAVHLLTYIGIAAAVPHQFLEGSTFRNGGAAWWFWFAIYVVAFGSVVVFRLVVPAVRAARGGLRVESVLSEPGGATSVRVSGPDVARLRVEPGQFLLWRFLDAGRWRAAHPFTVSDLASDGLRLTARPAGDGSAALATLEPGTRVVVEGPFGVFTQRARTKPGAVLVAAGIGITPVRALLSGWTPADGEVDVIWRVRALDEAPLRDEVVTLAKAAGARLHILDGARGAGWAARGSDATLAGLVSDVAERDVYICGPGRWADAVEDDARASGVARESVHREAFGFHEEDR